MAAKAMMVQPSVSAAAALPACGPTLVQQFHSEEAVSENGKPRTKEIAALRAALEPIVEVKTSDMLRYEYARTARKIGL